MPDRLLPDSANTRKLVNQLTEQLRGLTEPNCEIRLKRARPWASITFSGTRYLFQIDCVSNIRERVRKKLEEFLPEHEFDLTGHFVADAQVKAASDQADHIRIEILTITDPVI
ncbi:hypothetical protein [Parasphingorhabdus sp.]